MEVGTSGIMNTDFYEKSQIHDATTTLAFGMPDIAVLKPARVAEVER